MIRNVAASVRQRLLNDAQARGVDFQVILTHYAIERLLYRVQQSPHRNRFVLKGAMLFRVWEGPSARQTQDVDLLGSGNPEAMTDVFQGILRLPVDVDDGLVFDPASVRAESIRDDAEYRGVRVKLDAHLEAARIRVQVDIGFGDAVTPAPVEGAYPALLDLPAPRLPMYPRETVVAEKFQALVALSTTNTRMKDFYDLAHLADRYPFDGATLGMAVRKTFARRDTAVPTTTPLGLSREYLENPDRVRQWRSLTARIPGAPEWSLTEAGAAIRTFVLPATREGFDGVWRPGGPWGDAQRG